MSYDLNTNIQSKTIFLNSNNCIQRDPYYLFNLNTVITCPLSVKMLLSVVDFSMPNIIYNVSSYTNKLSFDYGGTEYTFIIPPNIYSAWTFRDYINVLFTNELLDLVCTYNHNTFKYSFSSPIDISIINTNDYPTTCSHLIGISKNNLNVYIFPVESGSPNFTITMPSNINFNMAYIFLKINNLNLTNINSYGIINDTLIRIPINCNYGEMIMYRPTEIYKFIINKSDIPRIEIKIEDIYNNTIDLLGAELQLLIKIDYVDIQDKINYTQGTIFHYIKENLIENENEDGEEEDNNDITE